MSLFELLIAMMIAAVIVAVGAPALQHVALNAKRASAVNGLTAAIQFARSSAQTRGGTLVLCKAHAALPCTPTGERWIVADPGEMQTLRSLALSEPDVTRSNRLRFEFRPFPRRSSNGTISFCDPRGGHNQRAIIISPSGRPRVSRPEADTGLAACDRD